MTTDKVLLEQMCAIAYEGITGQKIGHLKIGGAYIICPDLLNSRDAWAPLLEAMTDEQKSNYANELTVMLQSVEICFATARHNLEAALRMLNEWKPEMEGGECCDSCNCTGKGNYTRKG